jgi:hypothetical protein
MIVKLIKINNADADVSRTELVLFHLEESIGGCLMSDGEKNSPFQKHFLFEDLLLE